MQLSEIFLETLGNDYSVESIRRALDKCEEAIGGSSNPTEEPVLGPGFFEEDRSVTDKFYQLMDFWDVYKEFEDLLSQEENRGRWILRLVYELDGMHQCVQNENRRGQMSEEELMHLDALCKSIEKIYRAKELKFLVKQKGEWTIIYETNLDEFEEYIITFDYRAIQNRIMDLMERGGMLVVIAGSKGLTPQRRYGYLVEKGTWAMCPEEVVESVKDIAMADYPLARARGSLRGIR